MASRHDRIQIHNREGFSVLDLGEMDIWDGADMSLLRDTLADLIEDKDHRRIGVDLTSVKYIPSGFFGMLYDWHENGVGVRLYSPQPNVANMLWFRQFFEPMGNGAYRLLSEPREELVPETGDWSDEYTWWDDEPAAEVAGVRK